MVQLLQDGIKYLFEIGVVHHPAKLRVRIAADKNTDLERMPMQPATLVSLGHIRQTMRGFERKIFINFQSNSKKGREEAPKLPPHSRRKERRYQIFSLLFSLQLRDTGDLRGRNSPRKFVSANFQTKKGWFWF